RAFLSLLPRAAQPGQTLLTREAGGRLSARLGHWRLPAIERPLDPRTRARFPATARARDGNGPHVARSRERSRRGLLSMTCLTKAGGRRENQEGFSTPVSVKRRFRYAHSTDIATLARAQAHRDGRRFPPAA